MKLLVLGCNGQLGWELQRSLAPLGMVVALGRQGASGLSGDLSNPESLEETVKSVSPDVLVNAAAYTAVDRAESETEQARTVNARAPARLSLAAKETGAWFVHYSTDYVFDGTGSVPWREEDSASPVNIYGRTKLEGEEAILKSGCRHLIFRTSWVYSIFGANFIHTILRLAAERRSLKVVNDQIGAPTGADLIADITAHAIRTILNRRDLSGTYHLAAKGETSWWQYARLVVNTAAGAGIRLKTRPENIKAVGSRQFPTTAPRPGNSRLDTTRLEKAFGIYLPPWEQGVSRVVQAVAGCRNLAKNYNPDF